jgi:hypothetical protein
VLYILTTTRQRVLAWRRSLIQDLILNNNNYYKITINKSIINIINFNDNKLSSIDKSINNNENNTTNKNKNNYINEKSLNVSKIWNRRSAVR